MCARYTFPKLPINLSSCSCRCLLRVRNRAFSSTRASTFCERVSHSACLRSLDRLADSLFDCFLRCRFTSLSSCKADKLVGIHAHAEDCNSISCMTAALPYTAKLCRLHRNICTELSPGSISPQQQQYEQQHLTVQLHMRSARMAIPLGMRSSLTCNERLTCGPPPPSRGVSLMAYGWAALFQYSWARRDSSS